MIIALIFTLLFGLFSQDSENRWNSPGRCGTNCLFIYLGLLGADASFAEVAEVMPVGTQGSSIEELRVGSGKLGVESAVVFCKSPLEFSNVSMPFVAHVDLAGGGGFGHFWTVFNSRQENDQVIYRYFDGNDLGIKECGGEELAECFTGYLLVRRHTPFSFQEILLWLVFVVLGIFLAHHFNTSVRKWRIQITTRSKS